MDCGRVRTENVAERYLLGRLDEPEREAFEDHLVACGDCCGELADLCALQGELEREPRADRGRGRRAVEPSRRTWLLAVAAAVVAVAAGLGLWMRLQPSPAPEPVLAELGPVVQPESVPAAGPDLAELAAFEAPPYAPVRLRGSEGDAERRFADAMELLRSRRAGEPPCPVSGPPPPSIRRRRTSPSTSAPAPCLQGRPTRRSRRSRGLRRSAIRRSSRKPASCLPRPISGSGTCGRHGMSWSRLSRWTETG